MFLATLKGPGVISWTLTSEAAMKPTRQALNPLKSRFCNIDGRMFHVHG
jgi:hypothetical protein